MRIILLFFLIWSISANGQQKNVNSILLKTDQVEKLDFPTMQYNTYLLKKFKTNLKYLFKKKIDKSDEFVFLPISTHIYPSSPYHKVLPVVLRKTNGKIILAADINRNLNFDDDKNNVFVIEGTGQETLLNLPVESSVFSFIIDSTIYDLPLTNNKVLPKDTVEGFADTEQAIKIKFNNMRYGIFQDKYIIGVYDANFDGVYNESETDRYFVSRVGAGIVSYDESFPINQGFLDNIILLDSSYYKIDSIAKDGKQLTITPGTFVISDTRFVPSVLPNKLPPLKFYTTDGGTHYINDYIGNKKFLLIERWGAWCVGCIQQLPFIHEIYDKYKGDVTLISLNGGDKDKGKVKAFITKHNMLWINGYENNTIKNWLFRSMGYPCAILIDDSGKIVLKSSSFSEVLKFLKINSNNSD